MYAVKLQECHVLAASELRSVGSNTDISYGGSGSESARLKDCKVWDEEW